MSYKKWMLPVIIISSLLVIGLTGAVFVDTIDAQQQQQQQQQNETDEQDPFIMTVNSSIQSGYTNDTEYRITLGDKGTPDFNVSWTQIDGPGNGSRTGLTSDTKLNFDQPGKHRIEITGSFPHQQNDANADDKEKIISIDQWGDIKWESFHDAYNNAVNLKYNATDVPDLSNVTDLSYMFYETTEFNGDISNWDVSNVEKFNYMFGFAGSFNQSLSSWDVSNATKMNSMFGYGEAPYDQDLSMWNVSNVTKPTGFNASKPMGPSDIPKWEKSSQPFDLSVEKITNPTMNDPIEITVDVTNNGNSEDNQTVRVISNQEIVDHNVLGIQSGETQTQSFQFNHSGDIGDTIPVSLSSDTDSITESSTVTLPPNYLVEITNINETIDENGTITVDYQIENTGGNDTQDIDLEIDETIVKANSNLSVNSQETVNGSFDYQTSGTDDISVVVSSDNDSATRTVTVNSTDDTVTGSSSDSGILSTSVDLPVVGSVPIIPVAGILVVVVGVGGYVYTRREEIDYV